MKFAKTRIALLLTLVVTVQLLMPFHALHARAASLPGEPAAITLTSGRAGEPYEYQFQTDGGLPPLRWQVVRGELPEGLTLEPSGRIRGVPTVARREAYAFVVGLSDSSQPSQSAEQPCLLLIQAAPLRIVTTPNKLKIVTPDSTATKDDGLGTNQIPESSAKAYGSMSAVEKTRRDTEVTWPYVRRLKQADLQTEAPQMRVSTSSRQRSDELQNQFRAGKGPIYKRSDNLDPSKFIRIYEAPKTRSNMPEDYGRLIYEPRLIPVDQEGKPTNPPNADTEKVKNRRSTKLDADESSTIIIVPDPNLMDFDMPLNNLYITAELTSGSTKTPLEVIGYSEIGKSANAALAQQGMAFQSTQNIIAMMLNLAFTGKDVHKAVYGTNAPDVTLAISPDDRDKAEAAFRWVKPEILAIADFLQERKNLNLVEIIGTEIFWIDRASMQAIAKQFEDNMNTAFNVESKKEVKEKAIDDMLRRTARVLMDLEEPMTEIRILACDIAKYRRLSNSMEIDSTKEMVTRLEIVQEEMKEHNIDCKGKDKLAALAESLAIQIYAQEMARRAFKKLEKLFAPGYVSLDVARAKDTDKLTIKVESRSSDVEGPGIPALFEVSVKRFGAKIHLGDTFMFVKRLGLTEEDKNPPDPTPADTTDPLPPGLKEVNFAPSPGFTLGVTWFQRGDSAGAKFLRALAPTFGVNVSFMNFDDPGFDLATGRFTNTKGTDVEVGAGPIMSLFNNKLHFTYGWNLTAERRRTYFGVGFSFLNIADILKTRLKSN